LILFVAEESADDEVGDIYLNKVLFFSDALALQRLGRPITGARYQRLPMGPAARALLPVREQMIKDGDVKVVMLGKQRVTVPERKADRDAFSSDEIQLVREVMEKFRGDRALTISDRSHYESPGWNLVGEREDIPLESQLISMEPISARAKQRGRELAARFDW
jgi:uncharacterized phage-associated protein